MRYISKVGETVTTDEPGRPNTSKRYRIAMSEPFVTQRFFRPTPR